LLNDNTLLLLLGQLIGKPPIHPCTCHRTEQRNADYRETHTYLCKQRTWAGACQCPSEAECKSANDLAFSKLFVDDIHRISGYSLDVKPLYYLNGNEGY